MVHGKVGTNDMNVEDRIRDASKALGISIKDFKIEHRKKPSTTSKLTITKMPAGDEEGMVIEPESINVKDSKQVKADLFFGAKKTYKNSTTGKHICDVCQKSFLEDRFLLRHRYRVHGIRRGEERALFSGSKKTFKKRKGKWNTSVVNNGMKTELKDFISEETSKINEPQASKNTH